MGRKPICDLGKPLRVGLIGAGGMADYHVAGFKKAGAEVVAIADPNPEAAEAAAAKFEICNVYDSAEESFADHSRFLLRRRYESLFELPVDDYKGWAHGLKRCGYATDPNYAHRLISIIERYSLYNYDTAVGRQADDDALFILEHLRTSHAICKTRSLHYVIANPGDTYSDIAREFSFDLDELLSINDVIKDSEIKAWQEVYLQEKHDDAPSDMKSIVIGEGETMHSVAQRLGIKLSRLRELNPSKKDEPGTRLRLRK
jgi:LysM repeat protein